MNGPETRDQFTEIVEADADLTEAASGLDTIRAALVGVSKRLDRQERYDVHAHVAKAMCAVDDALAQLTAEVADE